MKTMYRAWWCDGEIDAIEILSETEKTVTTEDGTENKKTAFFRWFDTYEEAYKHLTEHAHRVITVTTEQQRQAQAFVEKVAALAPEKPINAKNINH